MLAAMARYIATALGVLLFAWWVWSGIQDLQQVECDACFEFQGRRECRTALGAGEKEATRAARDGACAVLARGVTESFACGGIRPATLTCRNQ